MSVEPNGERKGLMYVSTFWPVMLAALAGTWFLATSLANLGSQKESIGGMRRDIDEFKEKMAVVLAQNTVSITERAEFKINIAKLQDQFSNTDAQLKSEIASRESANVEIETQADAISQALGLQFSENYRWASGIHGALHELGAKFPQAPPGPWIFPNISNRKK